jgi:hypothetical protein
MKNFTTSLFLLLSINVFCQFPAPSNLKMQVAYISLGNVGTCNGKGLTGPAYCVSAIFDAPNFGSTTSTFLFYKIYCNNVCIDTLYSTNQDGIPGGIGIYYVTAVYSNPAGESVASNSNELTLNSFPIKVNSIDKKQSVNVFYNKITSKINLSDIGDYNKYRIISLNSKVIQSGPLKTTTIDCYNISNGLYIIELSGGKNQHLNKKIVINQ